MKRTVYNDTATPLTSSRLDCVSRVSSLSAVVVAATEIVIVATVVVVVAAGVVVVAQQK